MIFSFRFFDTCIQTFITFRLKRKMSSNTTEKEKKTSSLMSPETVLCHTRSLKKRQKESGQTTLDLMQFKIPRSERLIDLRTLNKTDEKVSI